ncbi:MAG: hypothetical protein D6798_04735 [Deltaproteobacteria bacterium]|nr:MAG: hypothetical protein D6798_04735 [Deltaproteobacteria bacterium]
MRRPEFSPLVLLALALAVGSGALEVGLRVSPRMGMLGGDVGALLLASIGLSIAYLVAAAVFAWRLGRKPYGVLLGALVLVHGALWYRFEVVLNRFASDPRVWGGLLGVVILAVGVAYVSDALVRRFRGGVILASLAVGLVGTGMAIHRSKAPSGRPDDSRPNVLVITLDTVRADHLSPYGSDNPTPTLDSLARDGVLFEHVVATAPVTEPSHLAIFTGQPPHMSGVVANGTRLGDRPALLWRAMRDHGWTTAGFVAGFPLHSRFGWAQGMDVYDDDFGRFRGLHSLSLVKAWDQLVLPAHTLRERRGDLVVERALGWLSEHHDESFFMWVHLFDPHAPYEAPGHPFDPPTDGEPLDLPDYWPPKYKAITSTEWLIDAYDAEIRYADELVGQLLDGLRFHNVLEDTIVVVTADHGESLTEHDYLFEHGDNLYDPSLLIPLIVRYPKELKRGRRVPCQVSNDDITPTLLSLTGLAALPEQQAIEREGRDLSEMLRGGGCTDKPIVSSTVSVRFVDRPPVDHSYREPERKLIRMGEGGESCFDLVADPGELHPVRCDPELGRALDEALAGATTAAAPETDSTTNAALEALGYIDGSP